MEFVQTVAGNEQPSMHAVAADTVSEVVDVVAGMDRAIATLMGLRAQALNLAIASSGLSELDPSGSSPVGSASREMRRRSLRAEFACALKISDRTAEAQLFTAEALTVALPSTLAALKAGEISYRHAQTMVDQTAELPATTRTAVEALALPYARSLTAAKFGRKLRTLVEAADPETVVERHQKAVQDREVQYAPAGDGMAWLSAYLPAAAALAGYNKLTEMARTLQTKDETRTLTQLRADVFHGLVLNGEPADGPPTASGPTSSSPFRFSRCWEKRTFRRTSMAMARSTLRLLATWSEPRRVSSGC